MQKVKLGDICEKFSSNIAQKDLENNFGKYPIYGAAGLIKNVEFYQQEREYLAIVKDGAGIGRVMKLPANSSIISTMQGIIPNDNVEINYLYYLLSYLDLAKYWSGSTIPHIYFKDYKNEEVNLPQLNEQKAIAKKLDKVTGLIEKRQKQIEKLDELVKSRFIEMFGDPNINNRMLLTDAMPNVCNIIDGDRGSSYPKQEELLTRGECLFLSAKNVTNEGFKFNDCVFISKEKDEKLRNGKLLRGDIVLTTRGTIGNLAYYSEKISFNNVRINSGMVILRVDTKLLNRIFFMQNFKLQLDEIKRKIANGSAQPQLPILMMKKINIMLPPIELQNKFAEFVEKMGKNKSAIKKSLSSLETLKKSLMQKYFG